MVYFLKIIFQLSIKLFVYVCLKLTPLNILFLNKYIKNIKLSPYLLGWNDIITLFVYLFIIIDIW